MYNQILSAVLPVSRRISYVNVLQNMATTMMDVVGAIANKSLVEIESFGVAQTIKHFEIEDPNIVRLLGNFWQLFEGYQNIFNQLNEETHDAEVSVEERR